MARIRKKLKQFQQFLQRNSELLSVPQRVHRHLWTRPDFLGAVFACGYSGVRVAAFFFFLKNWHISSHLLLKSVSFLQRRLSLKRKREWYSLFYVLTSQNEETDTIPFNLTYRPQNLAVSNFILKNFAAMIPKLNTYFLYHHSFHSNVTKF